MDGTPVLDDQIAQLKNRRRLLSNEVDKEYIREIQKMRDNHVKVASQIRKYHQFAQDCAARVKEAEMVGAKKDFEEQQELIKKKLIENLEEDMKRTHNALQGGDNYNAGAEVKLTGNKRQLRSKGYKGEEGTIALLSTAVPAVRRSVVAIRKRKEEALEPLQWVLTDGEVDEDLRLVRKDANDAKRRQLSATDTSIRCKWEPDYFSCGDETYEIGDKVNVASRVTRNQVTGTILAISAIELRMRALNSAKIIRISIASLQSGKVVLTHDDS